MKSPRQGFVRQAYPIATPIHSLPDDLLYDIALLLYHESTPPVSRGILAVSQVCQRWRKSTLSCCQLWSHVFLDGRRPSYGRFESYIQRSGSFPLHIALHGPFREDVPLVTQQILTQLLPHTDRWASLLIRDVPREIVLAIFNGMRRRKFPLLQTIRGDAYFLLQCLKLRSTYQLSEAELYHCSLAQFPKPSTTLTVLRLVLSDADPTLTNRNVIAAISCILRGAPNLRGLSVELPRVCVPKLEEFRIAVVNSELPYQHYSLEMLELPTNTITDGVLRSINLPRLRRLPYLYHLPSCLLNERQPNIAWPSLEMIALNNSLVTCDHEEISEDIKEHLKAISDLPLRELRLIGYNVLDSFKLGQILDSFPKLTSLELRDCYGFECGDLKDEIESRAQKLELKCFRVLGGSANGPMSFADKVWFTTRLQEFRWTHSPTAYFPDLRSEGPRLLPHWNTLMQDEWWFPEYPEINFPTRSAW